MVLANTFILLVSFAAAAHSHHVFGTFGDQNFSIEMVFGQDNMTVTMTRPTNAPSSFRATTNYHIFSRHLVAMRNSQEKECYIRTFIESEDQMRGRVENAEYNNGMIGTVKEDALNLEDVPPLCQRAVDYLLGPRIIEFCKDHVIYMLGRQDVTVLKPEDLHSNKRERRSVREFNVAGNCHCDEIEDLNRL